jgi:hypothetical protein
MLGPPSADRCRMRAEDHSIFSVSTCLGRGLSLPAGYARTARPGELSDMRAACKAADPATQPGTMRFGDARARDGSVPRGYLPPPPPAMRGTRTCQLLCQCARHCLGSALGRALTEDKALPVRPATAGADVNLAVRARLDALGDGPADRSQAIRTGSGRCVRPRPFGELVLAGLRRDLRVTGISISR